MSSSEQIIVEALGQQYAIGNKEVDRKKLASYCSKPLKPKTIANTITKLRQKGLIEFDASTIRLTAKGVKSIDPELLKPPSPEDHLERIKETLKGKQVQLFEALLDGEIHNKDDIAQQLNYENRKVKAFMNLTGALKKGKGLVIYPDAETIQINMEKVYPYGMP